MERGLALVSVGRRLRYNHQGSTGFLRNMGRLTNTGLDGHARSVQYAGEVLRRKARRNGQH